ncbi:MAG: sigma-70 family RNA polymerase sigma factor, partial [Phycisphaeraceae bacterium]|nr:sigma-70 family RNA polymerase sigma factor [Phycisphaeraceae bacterium]
MAKQIETEADLIRASVKGNNTAFGGLVSKYQSLVCAITYGATGDIGISEELAQEAFVRAWKDLAQLRELTKFRAWVCSIARTTISNYYRREKRNLISHATPLEAARAISSNVPDPGHDLIAKEQQAVVAQALSQLPESYREPLILFYRQNQSTRQVAEQLELSEDNVRTRLHRGRKMLKEQVVAMVETTLASTAPGKAFTVAVMASAGMAIKGSGVATAATTTGVSATTTTGAAITSVMSGVAAKIITAAAVAAMAVGAVSAYKRLPQTDQPMTQTNQITAVEEAQESIVPLDTTTTAPRDVIETAPNLIETSNVQAATMSDNPMVADAPNTEPTSIAQTTEVPGDSEYIFEPKGVLCGLITDKDTDEPVVGAEIVVYGISMPNGKLVTDTHGFYALEDIEDSKPYMITINSKEYIGKPDIDDDYEVSIEKDKQNIVHFQLEKACIADLWVKDEQGNAITGASIEVVDLVTNRSTAASRSNTITPTDQDGYSRIGGHPASKAGYMAIITHEGRTGKMITSSRGSTYHETKRDFASAHAILENTDPDIIPVFDVTLKKGKPIHGTIDYADGVPASDLKIVSEPLWWTRTNLAGRRTEVAPDGSFILSHITPEKYSISAYYPVNKSYKPIKMIDFSLHDGDLHLTLSEPSPQSLLTIQGTVKVIKKAPVGNLYIRINSYNSTTNTHGSSTS